jgi:hypothetical protein
MGVGVAITFSFYVFVSNKVNLNVCHNFTSLVKSLAFSRYLLQLPGSTHRSTNVLSTPKWRDRGSFDGIKYHNIKT